MIRFILVLGLFFSLSLGVFAVSRAHYFGDVDRNDWFYADVDYVNSEGLMTGYANDNFGPVDSVKRAELAAVLRRLDLERIEEVYAELESVRSYELSQLKGKSWPAYRDMRAKFPVEGVTGDVDYFEMLGQLQVLATASGKFKYEIVATSAEAEYFFIREVGGSVYGPFYDNVARIVKEIGNP